VQLPALGDGRDVGVRLEDLDVRVGLNISGAHLARLVDPQREGLRVIHVELQRNLFQVEDNVRGVLDDARDGRKLVENAVDLDRRDGGAFHRRQEHAAKSIADGRAKPSLKWLSVEPTEPIGQRFALELQSFGSLKTSPEQ